jgi:hypothetical protein
MQNAFDKALLNPERKEHGIERKQTADRENSKQ